MHARPRHLSAPALATGPEAAAVAAAAAAAAVVVVVVVVVVVYLAAVVRTARGACDLLTRGKWTGSSTWWTRTATGSSVARKWSLHCR